MGDDGDGTDDKGDEAGGAKGVDNGGKEGLNDVSDRLLRGYVGNDPVKEIACDHRYPKYEAACKEGGDAAGGKPTEEAELAQCDKQAYHRNGDKEYEGKLGGDYLSDDLEGVCKAGKVVTRLSGDGGDLGGDKLVDLGKQLYGLVNGGGVLLLYGFDVLGRYFNLV